jgi:hypothetical protein
MPREVLFIINKLFHLKIINFQLSHFIIYLNSFYLFRPIYVFIYLDRKMLREVLFIFYKLFKF